MTDLAIIGGTGLTEMESIELLSTEVHTTEYGETSGPVTNGRLNGRTVIFLPRHGNPHAIPPHKVNYRANIRALKDCGITRIIGINAVGGITPQMSPCTIVVPDQIIDYTWSRAHTFFEDNTGSVTHIDFTRPYSKSLRDLIATAAENINLDIQLEGTYGATQGPRLETAAEIQRLERDGCDIVGMTGMPEAALARELDIEYASISLVVNLAAGKSAEPITMDIIESNLGNGMNNIKRLLSETVRII